MLLKQQKIQKVSFQNTREYLQKSKELTFYVTKGKYKSRERKHAIPKSVPYRTGSYLKYVLKTTFQNKCLKML